MPHTEPAYVSHTEPTDIYNVMDYGAHANGVTDDAAHVQAAVDACHAAGGGTVYMPAGTYLFHALITLGGTTWDEHGVNLTGPGAMQVGVNVKSGVHVSGAGPVQTLVFNDDDQCSPFGALTQTAVGISGMDITTTCVGSAGGDDGSKWACCDNVVLDNIVAHGLFNGLAMYGCRDSLISNSIAYDIGSGGCAGFKIGEAGGDVQGSDNVRVTNCEAYSGGGQGFRLAGQAPGSSYVRRTNNVYMTDCYSHDIDTAWRASYASNLTFLRCVGEDSPYATNNMCLINVATAHLTDCTAAHKITSASDNGWWVTYGSEDCTNIVED